MFNYDAIRDEATARFSKIITTSEEDEARKSELIECAMNIKIGRKAYYEIGRSLRTIKENGSYSIAGFDDFLKYAKATHKLGRASVYWHMQIADIYDRLAPLVGQERMPDCASALGAMLSGLTCEQEIQVYKLALKKSVDRELVVEADITAAREEFGLGKIQPKDSPAEKANAAEDTPPASLPNPNDTERDDVPNASQADTNSAHVNRNSTASKHVSIKGRSRTAGKGRYDRTGKSAHARIGHQSKKVDNTKNSSSLTWREHAAELRKHAKSLNDRGDNDEAIAMAKELHAIIKTLKTRCPIDVDSVLREIRKK